MTNIRIYVYGHEENAKEFLHTFLDREGAMSYIAKHKGLFPNRFSHYSLWRGDQKIEDVLG